jgi:hypothetical protein
MNAPLGKEGGSPCRDKKMRKTAHESNQPGENDASTATGVPAKRAQENEIETN